MCVGDTAIIAFPPAHFFILWPRNLSVAGRVAVRLVVVAENASSLRCVSGKYAYVIVDCESSLFIAERDCELRSVIAGLIRNP